MIFNERYKKKHRKMFGNGNKRTRLINLQTTVFENKSENKKNKYISRLVAVRHFEKSTTAFRQSQ